MATNDLQQQINELNQRVLELTETVDSYQRQAIVNQQYAEASAASAEPNGLMPIPDLPPITTEEIEQNPLMIFEHPTGTKRGYVTQLVVAFPKATTEDYGLVIYEYSLTGTRDITADSQAVKTYVDNGLNTLDQSISQDINTLSQNIDNLSQTLSDDYALKNGTYPSLRAQSTTKDDVNLGSVNNWGASSDPSNDSNTTYATIGAVNQVKQELDNITGGGIVAGEIDTYAYCAFWNKSEGEVPFVISFGDSVPGYCLFPSSSTLIEGDIFATSPLSGTWVCMGYAEHSDLPDFSFSNRTTLFVRIL